MIIRQKSAYRSSSVALAFQNTLHDWNADERVKSSDDSYISDVNLVGLC